MWIGSLLGAAALWGAEVPDAPRRITSVVRSDPRTGKLVRSVVVTPKAVAERTVHETVIAPRVVTPTSPAPAVPEVETATNLEQTVELVAAKNALSPDLLHSVIQVESNYNPYAVSPKGAQGLMQLIPATAQRFGVSNAFNPAQNIEGGAKYLRYLLELYDWNYPLALAAYNAGEGAVAKYGGVPPYRETQHYVQSVAKRLEKRMAAKPAAPAKRTEPAAAPKDPNAPVPIHQIVGTDGTVRYVSRQ
jgi:soluble lytic murein transglycosylase-like protein